MKNISVVRVKQISPSSLVKSPAKPTRGNNEPTELINIFPHHDIIRRTSSPKVCKEIHVAKSICFN